MIFIKSAFTVSILSLMLSTQAFSGNCPSIACIIGLGCSPEVARGNLDAVDRTLKALASSHDFAADTNFQAQVERISNIADDSAKASEYFKLAGLDSLSAEEVSRFVGARSVNPERISAIRSATSLSEAKAKVVVEAVRKAMLGNLL